MVKCFKNSRGQFVPIASMVVFTIVVFLFAVINIYRVAKVKLKLQNIADAVALEVVSRGEAASLNYVTDRNEWLNHLYADPKMNTDPSDPNSAGCKDMSKDQSKLPGLSCVDRNISGFSFPSQTGAIGYARLVKTVNDAQIQAAKAYDTFSGVGGNIGQKALQDILINDITDLKTDPSIRLITWNSDDRAKQAGDELTDATNNPTTFFANSKTRVQPLMDPLWKALKVHDIDVFYDGKHKISGTPVHQAFHNKFSELLNQSEAVGWMEVDPRSLPKLTVGGSSGASNVRVGAGAIALKPVTVMGVTFTVSARSVAYLVPGSGALPVSGVPLNHAPLFVPTYWVKLVNAHE